MESNVSIGKLILLILVILTLFMIAAGCSGEQGEQPSPEGDLDAQLQLVENAMGQVLHGIESGKPEKLVFSEETKQALEAQEIGYIFSNTVVKNAIADKFALLYQKRDADGLLDFLSFLDANYAAGLLEEGQTFDIVFTDAYINDLKQFIMENGEYLKTNGENEIYSYGGSEFWLSSVVYIKYTYQLHGKEANGSVILGGTEYRHSQHDAYSEDSAGYFLVDKTAELIISQITATEKEPGNCHRCDGTGTVTKHFGVTWDQKEGYIYGKRCGLCDGTGWKD